LPTLALAVAATATTTALSTGLTATTLALARFLSTTLATAAGLFAAAFALVTLVLFPVCHLLTLPCSLTSNDAGCLIKTTIRTCECIFSEQKVLTLRRRARSMPGAGFCSLCVRTLSFD
jgi:hypothetical protein